MEEYEDRMLFVDAYLDMWDGFDRTVMKYDYKSRLFDKIPKANYMRHARILCNTISVLRINYLLEGEQERMENERKILVDKARKRFPRHPHYQGSEEYLARHPRPQYENLTFVDDMGLTSFSRNTTIKGKQFVSKLPEMKFTRII